MCMCDWLCFICINQCVTCGCYSSFAPTSVMFDWLFFMCTNQCHVWLAILHVNQPLCDWVVFMCTNKCVISDLLFFMCTNVLSVIGYFSYAHAIGYSSHAPTNVSCVIGEISCLPTNVSCASIYQPMCPVRLATNYCFLCDYLSTNVFCVISFMRYNQCALYDWIFSII